MASINGFYVDRSNEKVILALNGKPVCECRRQDDFCRDFTFKTHNKKTLQRLRSTVDRIILSIPVFESQWGFQSEPIEACVREMIDYLTNLEKDIRFCESAASSLYCEPGICVCLYGASMFCDISECDFDPEVMRGKVYPLEEKPKNLLCAVERIERLATEKGELCIDGFPLSRILIGKNRLRLTSFSTAEFIAMYRVVLHTNEYIERKV